MARQRNNKAPEQINSSNNIEIRSSFPNDLPDSTKDAKKLQGEESYIDLPDVKDIPGQEFVHAPSLGELADTTISSDGEEGRRVFERDDSEDFMEDTGGNVSTDERRTLAKTDYMPTPDGANLQTAGMDNRDFDNELLNEKGFGQEVSGKDLDVPGSEEDDLNESAGSEDEENNAYSLR